VSGRQRRADTERARRQQHILYRGINRRAGRAVRVLAVVFWTNVMTSTRSALAVYRVPYTFGG
jgi:hypothetical protein